MNLSNKYGSRIDTFVASDLYNLPLPVVPPADLSIVAANFAPSYLYFRMGITSKVVGFSPRDNPYIRGFGMYSNLADGLVDKSSAHFGSSNSWRVRFSTQRFGAALTGLVVNVAGTSAFTGFAAGALFTRELAPGMAIVWLDDNRCIRTGTVSTITNDNALVLSSVTANAVGSMLVGSTTAGIAYPLVGVNGAAGNTVDLPFAALNVMQQYNFFAGAVTAIYPPLGTITVTTGSINVVGKNTAFLTDMAVGTVVGWTDDLGVRRTGSVAGVTTDVAMTLSAVAYSNASGAAMLDLDHHLRIKCDVAAQFDAYTISIDPAYGAVSRRLAIHAMAEIEHTFAMSEAIF